MSRLALIVLVLAVFPRYLAHGVSASPDVRPSTGRLAVTTTYTNTTPLPIPESPAPMVTSTLDVFDGGAILDINVILNITHTWVGDLVVQLTSPGGTTIVLVDRPGRTTSGFGCASDNIITTLDDESLGGAVEDACPPTGASYTPLQPLSGFGGQNAAGTWTLGIQDFAGTDTGTLNSWSLVIDHNFAPMAGDDFYVTNEGTPLNILAYRGVLTNDGDADLDPLTAVLDTPPAHGLLTFNADGSFDYVPDPGFFGYDDIFIYHANDGLEDSPPATVTIYVNPIPVVLDDFYVTGIDTPLSVPAPGVLANDTNGDANVLFGELVSSTAHGSLVFSRRGGFDYTPNPGFTGTDSFTYLTFNGYAGSNVATVTITVGETTVPVGALQAFDDVLITGMDTPGTVTGASLLANDHVPAGVGVALSSLGTPLYGTVASTGDLITYTPPAGFAGKDRFGYTVRLATGETAQAIVWVTVWKPVPACRSIGGEPNTTVYALVPGAVVPTGADVYCRVVVENGQFIRPTGEIGVQQLIDLGILQAVEVFALGEGDTYQTLSNPVDVCLKGSGHVYFLNATGQPRVISAPPTWTSSDGHTCATISSAGTLVLVP